MNPRTGKMNPRTDFLYNPQAMICQAMPLAEDNRMKKASSPYFCHNTVYYV